MGTKRLFSYLIVVAAALVPSVALSASIDPKLAASFRPPVVSARVAETTLNRQRVALGRSLFFDPSLSLHSVTSCATCHNPGLSWGNGLPRAVGDSSQPMSLRSPTLLNMEQIDRFGWDGKFPTMEAVTFAAIAGHANMNLPVAQALARLRAIQHYRDSFAAAFPGQGLTETTLGQVFGDFERTIRSGPAPFDRWVAGDAAAIDDHAQRGFALFTGRAHCVECHSGWAFTDGSFHDIGTASGGDIGRGALFPNSRMLRYAFKTPTLRDVAHRAPYMHDGSIRDLAGVIALYNQGGIQRPSRAEYITPLHLTTQDQQELIAFLATLSEEPHETLVPVLPR